MVATGGKLTCGTASHVAEAMARHFWNTVVYRLLTAEPCGRAICISSGGIGEKVRWGQLRWNFSSINKLIGKLSCWLYCWSGSKLSIDSSGVLRLHHRQARSE